MNITDKTGNKDKAENRDKAENTGIMETEAVKPGPIGVFDSGYGGLTILHQMRQTLPQYDYLYLGDNARAPYGPRSFDIV